ncbi:MAG: exosortase [Rhodospirillaceae bacterium]|nr:exosortase [Rhodospirillales bacterium]
MTVVKYASGALADWRSAALVAIVFVSALSVVYIGTVSGIVNLWSVSSAYNHGFLILPLALWLIWDGRGRLQGMTPAPSSWGVAAMAGFAVLWLLAHLAGIAEGTHFALIGMVQSALLSVVGRAAYLRLLLPFSYLWLMVPTGEGLLPLLQDYTAGAASALLSAVGVPTLLEGLHIEVPSGSYFVAPGCAGLNFLLSGLAVSLAYAALIYQRPWKRVAFVAAMVAVAIGGNWLRVFLIVLVGHLTDNQADIVDDHLLWGWGGFTVLMLAVMALGNRFRDPAPDPVPGFHGGLAVGRFIPMAAAAALVAVAALVAAGMLSPDRASAGTAHMNLSCGTAAITIGPPGWSPELDRVDAAGSVGCLVAGQAVDLTMVVLERPVRQGKLLGMEHRMADPARWRIMDRQIQWTEINGVRAPVQAFVLEAGGRQRLMWMAVWVDGAWRQPGLAAMAADLRSELLAGRRHAAVVSVATDLNEASPAALAQLLAHLPFEQ